VRERNLIDSVNLWERAENKESWCAAAVDSKAVRWHLKDIQMKLRSLAKK
jgi:hypothetical protein